MTSSSTQNQTVTPRAVVLYDGDCGLCDRSVGFILKRDHAAWFHFAALQSDWAKTRLQALGMPVDALDTMVLLEDGHAYVRSTAALRIARRLPWWRWAYVFIVVPAPVRDVLYRWISRNRIRWFGRTEACGVPKPGWRQRFIA